MAKRFAWHAESASARQGFNGTPDEALSSWLQQLTELDALVRRTQRITENEESFLASEDGGMIYDVCLVSAEYCRKCEANETTSDPREKSGDCR